MLVILSPGIVWALLAGLLTAATLIYYLIKNRKALVKAEKKLKTAEEENKNLNKELESFSYSVSHDLRAPLRSINGYVEILNEEFGEKLDPEAQRLLRVISNNAKRMGRLIDDLLNFSKVARSEVLKTETSMNEMVKGVIAEFPELQSGKNIELTVHELGNSSVDVNLIRQVWVNLISNAIKFSEKKELRSVEIGVLQQQNEKVYYVKDNGTGFNMKYVHKLFGIFQRLHKAEEFEGTGVGLALVKRILDRHHGKIWVEARENEGATFYFSVP